MGSERSYDKADELRQHASRAFDEAAADDEGGEKNNFGKRPWHDDIVRGITYKTKGDNYGNRTSWRGQF